jgi:hypothetical protein
LAGQDAAEAVVASLMSIWLIYRTTELLSEKTSNGRRHGGRADANIGA